MNRFVSVFASEKESEDERAIVVCDSCGFEFAPSSIAIVEKPIWLDGVEHIVSFFQCPRCDEFYFVALYDEKHEKLVAEYEKALSRLNKNHGKATEKRLEKLAEIAYKKQARIAVNLEQLRRKYPGTFTVQRDANGADFVVYAPLDDGESEK